jgi:hypothetical protein
MSRTATVTSSVRTWRDIPQEIAPRAMSRVGRKRLTYRTVRSIAATVTVVAIGAGAFEIWRTWSETPQLLAAPVDSQPVKTVTVQSDGVLNQAWVERTLALPRGVGLMELDLYSLRTRLMASGQVASAVLTREFPDTLKVVLAERSPVVRLKAQLGAESPRDFLVARDGTVFLGEGFSSDMVDTLPWLAGVRLVREGSGFLPLAGMDRVSELLATAISNTPRLYAGWRIVSLERMNTDGEILVQSAEVGEIVFGLREDFFSQIARLDLILERTAPGRDQPLRSVNLAVGPSQVPVAFGIAVGPTPSSLSAPHSNRSSRNREL